MFSHKEIEELEEQVRQEKEAAHATNIQNLEFAIKTKLYEDCKEAYRLYMTNGFRPSCGVVFDIADHVDKERLQKHVTSKYGPCYRFKTSNFVGETGARTFGHVIYTCSLKKPSTSLQ
jgi:hypothetical protein